jgi:hypothetical protein
MDCPEAIVQECLLCINYCARAIQEGLVSTDIIVTRLESLNFTIAMYNCQRSQAVAALVEEAIFYLERPTLTHARGRPTVQVDMRIVEHLLAMRFCANKIAQMLGVAERTLRR